MQHRNHATQGKTARPSAWLAGAIAMALGLPAFAQDKPTVEELQRRLEALEQRYGGGTTTVDGQPLDLAALDQRLRALERNLELQEEARVAREKEAPVIAVNNRGASLKSNNGDFEVRIRGLFAGDGRFYVGDTGVVSDDTFLLRVARPTIEGTLGKWIDYRFTPEFAGDNASIVDAYADLKFSPAATLRMGKFTPPVGLERLQSSASLALMERAFVSELLPNRDIGLALHGLVAGGKVSYAVGVFNGAVDGRDAPTTNPDGDFDIDARVFVEPFKDSGGFWSGLGVGIGGSTGETVGLGNNVLPRYRTPGQLQFFNYRVETLGDGRRTRWSPQAYFYRNRFGLMAEYAQASQEVRVATQRAELENTAWQATASWVLTGEDASYRGVVKPSRPFSMGKEGWGAWELVARYGVLEVDEAAFPVFANPAVAAQRAESWSVGANWYLTSNLRLVVNYLQTGFDGGAAAGGDRKDERAVFTRVGVAF